MFYYPINSENNNFEENIRNSSPILISNNQNIPEISLNLNNLNNGVNILTSGGNNNQGRFLNEFNSSFDEINEIPLAEGLHLPEIYEVS